jgi:pimeloyl-ACP methyl ester carboxylesterase
VAALESHWTTLDGMRVHSRRGGPPGTRAIVLVHGIGVSSRYFVPLGELLAERWRVVAVDLPGWDGSDSPPSALDIPGLAGELGAWLDAEQLDRPYVVANSLGCQITIDLAAREPERFERIVLIGPTVDPRYRTPLRHAPRFFVDAVREPPSLLPIIVRDYLRFGLRRFVATAGAALRDRPEDKLPGITSPTLVIKGARDAFVSRDWVEEIVELLPRGELAVVPRAPHATHYAAPRSVAALVEGFISD